jgi:hypothetical protein
MSQADPQRQLHKFVTQSRQAGVSFRTIKHDLLNRGWTAAAVDPILTEVRLLEQNMALMEASVKNPELLMPKKRTRVMLWVFVAIFIIAALVLTVVAVQPALIQPGL